MSTTTPTSQSPSHHGGGATQAAPSSNGMDFKHRISQALADQKLRFAVDRATHRQDDARKQIITELPEALETRKLAARIKDHTLQNLDRYMEQFVANVQRNGGHVHFARTPLEACEIVTEIARSSGSQKIVKAKSMVSEEIELNHALQLAGCEVTETDLGEYIIQLLGDKPSHIVGPAIHLTKEDIGKLFAEKLGIPYTTDPPTLTAAARSVLREKFRQADMGITGANFAIAETGSVCIVTNEGNGRLSSSRPRVVVSIMGMEKMIPRVRDLGVFLKLLAKSATGQRITCYTSILSGPKRADDADGPEEFHVVILDHGRSNVLGSDYRQVLRCLRCGACLNTCPVYRRLGGHAYGSVYPGPIGTMITPLLFSMEAHADLPQASSLCGACLEACPVRIDIPSMLLHMRNDLRKQGHMPFIWRIGFKFWRIGMQFGGLYRLGSWMGKLFMKLGSRNGWNSRLYGPAAGWTQSRDFPAMAAQPFYKRWESLSQELQREDKA